MQDLAIALIQLDIKWQNPSKNRQLVETKIEGLETNPDLIVLPEMFTTGFTMEVETNAELPEGETLQWMKSISKLSVYTNSIIDVTGSICFVFKDDYSLRKSRISFLSSTPWRVLKICWAWLAPSSTTSRFGSDAFL